ncbi:hypothetical protein ACS386_04155 [Flavobacteriaceae bacterium LMO-SS05]
MKRIGLILCFLLSFTSVMAQDTYTVSGETLQLKTEVEGQLDLLWNIIDGHYRYFVRTTDHTITELVNTKNKDHKYTEEYKTLLQNLTDVSTDKVNLTLVDLKTYIDTYNQTQDPNYKTSIYNAKLQLLLGFFGGITNSPFINNPNNSITPQFGAELELLDANQIKRHALFMQLRHVFKTNDFKYTTTELALGYRFRVINSRPFSLYGQTKLATLNFLKNTIPGANDTTLDTQGTVLEVPLTFGIGADIRLSEKSFFTIRYDELFAVLIENNGNFSTNLTLGYKFNL